MKRYSVWEEWANIVGLPVAEHATPLKWMQNVLLVGVDDSSWLTELRMMEGEILEKIRSRKPDLKIDGIRWTLS